MFCYFEHLLIYICFNGQFSFHDGLEGLLGFWSNVELVVSLAAHIDTFFYHFAYFADDVDILLDCLVDLFDNWVGYIFLAQVFDQFYQRFNHSVDFYEI